jgi:hypothetical protein
VGGYAVDVGGEGVADGFVVGTPYVCDLAAWCGFVDGEGVIGGGMGRGHDVDQFGRQLLWGPDADVASSRQDRANEFWSQRS